MYPTGEGVVLFTRSVTFDLGPLLGFKVLSSEMQSGISQLGPSPTDSTIDHSQPQRYPPQMPWQLALVA